MPPNDMLRKKAYLDAMGIDVWERREAPQFAAAVPSSEPAVVDPLEGKANPAPTDTREALSGVDWEALRGQVSACTLCELHKSRTQTVFGVGNQQAELLVIGEAPGAEEDRQGEPFVGRAGQLLNAMLKAIRFERRDVYIANILKCRPPNNRDPKPEEAALCSRYLKRQIELIRPRLILAVGRIAAQRLLQTDLSLAKLRGQVHRYPLTDTPLIVTYHPAYLLRTPADKRKAWQDLLFVQRILGDQAKAG